MVPNRQTIKDTFRTGGLDCHGVLSSSSNFPTLHHSPKVGPLPSQAGEYQWKSFRTYRNVGHPFRRMRALVGQGWMNRTRLIGSNPYAKSDLAGEQSAHVELAWLQFQTVLSACLAYIVTFKEPVCGTHSADYSFKMKLIGSYACPVVGPRSEKKPKIGRRNFPHFQTRCHQNTFIFLP